MNNDELDDDGIIEAIKNDSHANDKYVFGLEKKLEHDLIGYVYYFLVSMYNLIETRNDETPVIDSKGNLKGRVGYSVAFDVLDPFTNLPIDTTEHDSLAELIGKKLKVTLQLKKASDLPEKQSNEVYAKYQWLDEDRNEFMTEKHAEKSTAPTWNYRKEHTILIDEDLVNNCMSNTLAIGIYGKADIKAEDKWRKYVEDNDGGGTISQKDFFGTDKDVIVNERVTERRLSGSTNA